MAYTPHLRYGGELYHYRTKGSKNGVRRYQNLDGSLTAAGYARYGVDPNFFKNAGRQVSNAANNVRNWATGGDRARANAQYNTAQARNTAYSMSPARLYDYGKADDGKTYRTPVHANARINSQQASNAQAARQAYTSQVQNYRSNFGSDNARALNKMTGREGQQIVGNKMQKLAGDEATTRQKANKRMLESYNAGRADREEQQANANKLNAQLRRADTSNKEYKNSLSGKMDKAIGKVLGDKNEKQKHEEKAERHDAKARDTITKMDKYAAPSTWFDKDEGKTGRDYSQQMADKYRAEAGRAAQERKKAKDETIGGRFENAKNNVGNWLKDRANEVGETAKKAADAASKSWVTNPVEFVKEATKVANKAGEKAGEAAKNVKEWATGKNAVKAVDDASVDYIKKNAIEKKDNFATNIAKKEQSAANRANRDSKSDEAKQHKKASDDAKRLSNQVKREQREDTRNAYNNLKNAERNYYNNTLQGKVDKAMNKLDAAVKNIKEATTKTTIHNKNGESTNIPAQKWLNDRFNNAKDAVSDAANKAGKAISEGASNATKEAAKVANKAGKAVDDARKNAADFVGNLFGRKKKKK